MTKKALLLAFAILAYCLINSYELFNSWIHAPYEKMSWILFLIWCFPLFLIWTIKFAKSPTAELRINFFFLWGALSLTLFGVIGSLNAFIFFGLALAIASFFPWGWPTLIWLCGSLAWMPAIGWIGSHYFSDDVFLIRLILAIIACAAGMWNVKTCIVK